MFGNAKRDILLQAKGDINITNDDNGNDDTIQIYLLIWLDKVSSSLLSIYNSNDTIDALIENIRSIIDNNNNNDDDDDS